MNERTIASDSGLISRLSVLAIAGFLLAVGFRIFPATDDSVLTIVALFTCYISAFLLMSWAFIGPLDISSSASITAVAFLFGVACSVAFGILFEVPTYGTDVMSFTHAAARGLLDGLNPYELTIDQMRPVLNAVGYHDGLATPTIGSPLERLFYYPAGHVLYFVPYLGLGLEDLRWATLVVQVLALGFVWWAVSPLTRVLLPLMILLEPYLATIFTSGGNSDWLWVFPLSISAYLLHRGNLSWSGFWLGVACAVKQQPWFALPFMLIYGWKNRRTAPGTGFGAMLGMLGLGFILPNLPFLLWNPSAWIDGVLGPLVLNLAPAGQGVSLLDSQGWIELTKPALISVMLVIATACLTVYWWYFPRVQNLLWVLPGVILFFSPRSLHSYFVYWIPIAILWLDMEHREDSTSTEHVTSSSTRPS